MTRRVLKKPKAERDLIDHFAYAARDKVRPANKFLDVAEEAIKNLAAMPTIGRNWKSDNSHTRRNSGLCSSLAISKAFDLLPLHR
jgi:plasmid stabilization system protein ParE